MKVFLTVLFTLFSAVPARAYDRGELAEYNDMYKSGNFQGALDGYNEMISKEPDNPYGFYNAGNAWFRMNRPGKAILYYSKALRLNPRGSDIRANLEFALKHTGQSLVPEGVPHALHYLYYLLSDRELKAAAVLAWWAFFLLLSLRLLKPGNGEARTLLSAAGAIFALSILWFAARGTSAFRDGAVITAEGSTRLMSGPGDNFTVSAALPEARLVKILDESDDNYYEVGIQKEAIRGWIKKSSAEKI